MKNIRTDMASEIREEYMKTYSKQHEGEPDGIKYEASERCGIKTTKISVFNEKGAEILGKPMGNYYSMHTGKLWLSDFDKFKCAANELVKIISSGFALIALASLSRAKVNAFFDSRPIP